MADADESSTGQAPDMGGVWEVLACDPYAPECEPGLKCQPGLGPDGDGGCVPEGADDVESACAIGDDGVDSCVGGAYCVPSDDTGMLGCVPLCGGTPTDPSCAGLESSCARIEGVAVCLPACSPIHQDCPTGQGCYPSIGEFACAAAGDGEPGSSCVAADGCIPGLLCVAGESCQEFCDLDDPACDCAPYFEPGAAPPGLESVGVCL